MTYWKNLAKDWGIALVIVVAAFFTWQLINSRPLQEGGLAPAFQLTDLDNSQVQLANFADQTVVLNFWFTDCPPCRHEIPELVAFHDAHPDIPLLGISVDRMNKAQLTARSGQLGINYPVLHDRDLTVASAYGVSVFPTTMVLVNGEIKQVRVGEIDGNLLLEMVNHSR